MTEAIKARLLIVDDEEDMLKLLKRSLSVDLSCEIETASNAFQALALLEGGPFDVVLADIRMPGMGGMEVLKNIKEKNRAAGVIMLSAYGDPETVNEALRLGADALCVTAFPGSRHEEATLETLAREVARALALGGLPVARLRLAEGPNSFVEVTP